MIWHSNMLARLTCHASAHASSHRCSTYSLCTYRPLDSLLSFLSNRCIPLDILGWDHHLHSHAASEESLRAKDQTVSLYRIERSSCKEQLTLVQVEAQLKESWEDALPCDATTLPCTLMGGASFMYSIGDLLFPASMPSVCVTVACQHQSNKRPTATNF